MAFYLSAATAYGGEEASFAEVYAENNAKMDLDPNNESSNKGYYSSTRETVGGSGAMSVDLFFYDGIFTPDNGETLELANNLKALCAYNLSKTEYEANPDLTIGSSCTFVITSNQGDADDILEWGYDAGYALGNIWCVSIEPL